MRDSKLIRGLLSMFMLGTLAFGVAACGEDDAADDTTVVENETTMETEMETEPATDETGTETESPTG